MNTTEQYWNERHAKNVARDAANEAHAEAGCSEDEIAKAFSLEGGQEHFASVLQKAHVCQYCHGEFTLRDLRESERLKWPYIEMECQKCKNAAAAALARIRKRNLPPAWHLDKTSETNFEKLDWREMKIKLDKIARNVGWPQLTSSIVQCLKAWADAGGLEFIKISERLTHAYPDLVYAERQAVIIDRQHEWSDAAWIVSNQRDTDGDRFVLTQKGKFPFWYFQPSCEPAAFFHYCVSYCFPFELQNILIAFTDGMLNKTKTTKPNENRKIKQIGYLRKIVATQRTPVQCSGGTR